MQAKEHGHVNFCLVEARLQSWILGTGFPQDLSLLGLEEHPYSLHSPLTSNGSELQQGFLI